jgi:phosphoenolpyruvate-protein kinase (PTS system EI component)
MKKTFLAVTSSTLFSIAALTSCSTPAEKVDQAQENVNKANNKLDSAIKDYLADIDMYRVETANRIIANDKSIADFNLTLANKKMNERAEYVKKIKDLEQKNAALKSKLDNYKADGNEKWKTFKVEFSKEMDDLGESIKDLTKKDD